MRGESRHDALSGQIFLDEAKTNPRYRLYLIEDYPGLVDADERDGVSIVGEIWSVDQQTLKQLDSIECVDNGLYERRKILLDGSIASADAWFYLQSCERLPEIGSNWRSR